MSGAQTPTSSEAQRNVLFNPLAVPQAQDLQNKLAGQQLDLSNANMEQVARASAGLLSAYPDEASRAAAYPRVVGMLQSQGFAKQAPAQYPGEGVLRSLVNQSIPASDQYKLGILNPPGLSDALARASAPPPAYGATGLGTAPPAAGGGSGGPSFAGGIAGFESGGVSNPPENSRWPVAQGGPAGPHQFIASTWNQFAQANPDLFKGMTPDQILAARTDTTPVGPNGEDRSTLATNWYAGENAKVLQARNIPPTPTNLGIAHALGAGGATKVLSAPDNTPLSQVIPETIPQNPQYGRMTVGDLKQRYARLGPVGGGTATASATPATAPAGGGAAPGRTQVASTAPVALPAATTEPPPPTVATPATTAAPAGTPPAATAAPVSAQPAQPGATPLPGTGVNSQQFQTALWKTQQAAQLETQFPNSLAAKAKAAELRAEAALYMQADSVITLPNGIQVKALSGQQVDAAKPAEMWVQQPNGTLRNPNTGDVKSAPTPAEVWVKQPDGTYINQATGKPESAVTPAEMWVKQPDGTFLNINTGKPMALPPGRLQSTPGGVVIQSQPGGGARVVYSTSPEDVTAQAQAHAAGAAAGQTAGKLPGQLADLGRSAGQAIGNIDYGMSQIQKAKEGGINSGYFAPWLSTVGAIAKSIGGDTGAQLLGINPAAVGNVQTAQKTLAVVSGAILQQVLGPDSQVTDAKIQHFIHAQPGIETDPDALNRVLNWARSQFVYEREMAAQGMKDARDTGTLPPGWQAKYFDEHGFAPVYNPTVGEMQQPDGTSPPRQAPANLTTAPINPSARTIGTVYSTPKGPMKWTGTGWLPVQ